MKQTLLSILFLAFTINGLKIVHAEQADKNSSTYSLVSGFFGYNSETHKSTPFRQSAGHAYTLFNGLDVEQDSNESSKSVAFNAADESFYLNCARVLDEAGQPVPKKYALCEIRLVVDAESANGRSDAKLLLRGHLAQLVYRSLVKYGTVKYKTGETLVSMSNISCSKMTNEQKTTTCTITAVGYSTESLDSVFKDADRRNRILEELGL